MAKELETALGLAVSDVLLDKLNLAFPDKVDQDCESLQELGKAQGRRQVIDYLAYLKQESENTIYNREDPD